MHPGQSSVDEDAGVRPSGVGVTVQRVETYHMRARPVAGGYEGKYNIYYSICLGHSQRRRPDLGKHQTR